MLRFPHVFCIGIVLAPLAVLLLPARAAHPPPAQWTRIRLTRTLPSQVFARLGLTHITRRGYTRDGAKKTDPDPHFPPGLIDVVPYDAEHVLLVRGTPQGVLAFRTAVTSAETQLLAARWHVQAELMQTQGSAARTLGAPWQADIPDDMLTMFTLGDPVRNYQIRVRPAGMGGFSVQWQAGLPLPAAPPAPGVFAPPLAWTPVQTRISSFVLPVTFDDLAEGRRTARAALSLPPDLSTEDYQVRITITPLAVVPAPAIVAPAVPLALPPPPADTGGLE